MSSDQTSPELVAVTRLLFGPPRTGWQDERQRQRELLVALETMPTSEMHRILPPRTWRSMSDFSVASVKQQGTPAQIQAYPHGAAVGFQAYTMVGAMAARRGTGVFDQVAERHPVDFTRPAVVLAQSGTGQAWTLSAKAFMLALGGSHLSHWWMRHRDGARSPLDLAARGPCPDWLPTEDLQSGARIAEFLNVDVRSTSFHATLVQALSVARSVDLDWFIGFGPAQPVRNKLIDTVARLHSAARLFQAHDLVHLVLREGVDLTPAKRQPSLLHVYASFGNAAACLKLLEGGHPLEQGGQRVRSAAQIAEAKGHDEVASLLRSFGARQAAQLALLGDAHHRDIAPRSH